MCQKAHLIGVRTNSPNQSNSAMVIKLRGSKIHKKFFYFGEDTSVLSTPQRHGTWHNFKYDEPWTYLSLIGSVVLPPLIMVFGHRVRSLIGWEDETIHYPNPRLDFDHPFEERHKFDDEGIEYEFVYSDGTRVFRK